MDTLNFFIERLLHHLWAVSWQVSILVTIIWIIDRFTLRASPVFRYWLWLIVLFRLCIPVNLTLPYSLDQFIRNNLGFGVPAVHNLVPFRDISQDFDFKMVPLISIGEPAVNFEEIETAGETFPANIRNFAGMLWLVTVTIVVLLILAKVFLISRRLKSCAIIKRSDLCALFRRLKIEMGIKHLVGLHYMDIDNVDVPAVIGVVSPRIFLPRNIADEWAVDDIEPVLLHELAHVKRRDLVINWLQVIVQVVYFFHPLAWYANRRIRQVREELCDDIAVNRLGGGKKLYTQSILRVMEETFREPSFGFVGIGFLERKHSLGERIKRIMNKKYKNNTKMTIFSVIMLVSICILGFLISCGTSTLKVKEPQSEKIIMKKDGSKKKTYKDLKNSTISLAVARGKNLEPPEALISGVKNITDAMNRYTDIDTKFNGEISLDSPALFNFPLIFISADTAFTLTENELSNLKKYLVNGGFAIIDNGTPEIEWGEVESSLRHILIDALGADAKFLPIPINYSLYHCYYDFDDGPPNGYIPANDMKRPYLYLEGIFLEDRLVAVYSDRGYIYRWSDEYGNEPQLRFGVNLILFAALQENGMIQKKLSSKDNSSIDIDIKIDENGEYKVEDKPANESNLSEVLRKELEKGYSKKIVVYAAPQTTHKQVVFLMDTAKNLNVESIAFGIQESQSNSNKLFDNSLFDVNQHNAKVCTLRDSNAVLIKIIQNGNLEIDGTLIDNSELLQILEEEMEKKKTNSITIQTSPETLQEHIQFVMKTAKKLDASIGVLYDGMTDKQTRSSDYEDIKRSAKLHLGMINVKQGKQDPEANLVYLRTLILQSVENENWDDLQKYATMMINSEEVERKKPESANYFFKEEAYYLLGSAFETQGRGSESKSLEDPVTREAQAHYINAVKYYKDGYKKFPDSFYSSDMLLKVGILYLTKLYETKNALDLATEKFEEYIQKFPYTPNTEIAHYYLGFCYYNNREFKKAKRTFNDFIDKYSNSYYIPEALFYSSESSYNIGDLKEAIRGFDRLIERYPQYKKTPEALYTKAWAYLDLEREEEAIETFWALIDKYPESKFASSALFTIGDYHFSKKNYEKAKSTYEKFLKLYPDSVLTEKVMMKIKDTEAEIGKTREN